MINLKKIGNTSYKPHEPKIRQVTTQIYTKASKSKPKYLRYAKSSPKGDKTTKLQDFKAEFYPKAP